MLDFFSIGSEDDDDRFTMIDPQTNFFFHKILLIDVYMNRLF